MSVTGEVPYVEKEMTAMPLADKMRPKTLDEVAGQKHLLGKNAPFRRIAESGRLPSLVFYGPPGTGKTTIADIIAHMGGKSLYKVNATVASTGEVKDILARTDTLMNAGGIVLYIDEIQYFNKKQQQSLLEYVEDGRVTLICSTTENPYFIIYTALLSRATVFEFRSVPAAEILPVLERGLAFLNAEASLSKTCPAETLDVIASGCGGDVRKAVTAVELLYQSAKPKDGVLYVTSEDALQLAQRSAMRYDRDGDEHYDLLSALQKSIRGSDPDAAVYYLGRLLVAGDLLSPCRRLLVIASEDIGLAYPQAIAITKACVDAAVQLGLPEARLPLAEAAILLATAPKSNASHNAIIAAMEDIQRGAMGSIPRHLQNVHADSAGQEREQGYLYPHVFPHHYVKQRYLPEELGEKHYYEYGDNKTEQAAKRYWDEIKKG